MTSHLPTHPRWRRSEHRAAPDRPNPRSPRGRLPIVLCVAVVLAITVGTAVVTRAVDRPAPSRTQVAVAAVAAPAQAATATYTAAITNGAAQNDLYDWLTGRAGTIVHLVLSISKPAAADLIGRPRSITMSSNCSTAKPPSNCARSLNLNGTRYLLYGDAKSAVTLRNGVYQVDAYVAVDPVTQDSTGMYTLPLRIVDPGGPVNGEDD